MHEKSVCFPRSLVPTQGVISIVFPISNVGPVSKSPNQSWVMQSGWIEPDLLVSFDVVVDGGPRYCMRLRRGLVCEMGPMKGNGYYTFSDFGA